MRSNVYIGFLLAFLFTASMAVTAQRHPQYSVEVTCSEKTPGGSVITEFTANVKPKIEESQRERAFYNWTVSVGTIVEGQGTDKIQVQLDKEAAERSVSAQVQVAGDFYYQTLSNSCTTEVGPWPKPRLIAEMGFKNVGLIESALDGLFFELQKTPTDRGHVAIYASTNAEFARMKAQVMRRIKAMNFDAERIEIVRGAKARPGKMKLWTVSLGMDKPEL